MASPDGKLGTVKELSDAEINAVFDNLQSIAHFQVKGAGDATFWATIILAMRSSVVCITNLGGWYRVTEDFRCIGDGSLVATGAMHVLKGVAPLDSEVKKRLADGLKAGMAGSTAANIWSVLLPAFKEAAGARDRALRVREDDPSAGHKPPLETPTARRRFSTPSR